jgi:ribosomal protein S18 acetylase RimI-like enzyme
MGETVCDLLAEFEGGTRFFVAVEETQSIVGAVRARRTADSVHVGRLVVDDDWTRCGVATNLMRALEASFPSEAFELFTGADAEAPLALYLKLGYRVTRRDEEGPVPLVWLEKRPRAAASE